MSAVDDARMALRVAEAAHARVAARLAAARRRSEAATPGGLHGDPATLSGVQRGPSGHADARRSSAYDAEAGAVADAARASREVERRAAALARAERDAEAPRDLLLLAPGCLVRDKRGWLTVVKVNRASVRVVAEPGMDDRLLVSKILEIRERAS